MNKEKKNDFLFSVVIPVYKVEDYVEETIQSVLQPVSYTHLTLPTNSLV